ncbi:hypothetical protein XENOCAPTIV_000361 [Xenoophorus captivus]|uniref:Synaptopodin 2 n=1 Tax=Xenoophorus captivus TaxID=1517983 RepID=A0ABV0QCF5_9TELE
MYLSEGVSSDENLKTTTLHIISPKSEIPREFYIADPQGKVLHRELDSDTEAPHRGNLSDDLGGHELVSKHKKEVQRCFSPGEFVELQVSLSEQTLDDRGYTSLGSARGFKGDFSTIKTVHTTSSHHVPCPVREPLRQHGVVVSAPSVEVTLKLPDASGTGRGTLSVGGLTVIEDVGLQSEKEEGGELCQPAPGSFTVSFEIPSDEATLAEDQEDSDSEGDQEKPNKHRAKHARLFFLLYIGLRRNESLSEKQVKEAKSKCKRIALLLSAAPPNPHNKGVLMFKKHRQRAKKYTLVSYGTGEDEPEFSDEEDEVNGDDKQEILAGEFSFEGTIDCESNRHFLLNAPGSKGVPTCKLEKSLVEINNNLNEQAEMECYPETKGKGALMFAQRRQRMDEITAEHEELRRHGLPSSYSNRTAKPFTAANVVTTPYSHGASGTNQDSVGQGEQIASRDERISTPAIRTGLLLDSRRKNTSKPMFTFKEAPKVSPNPALLNLLNRSDKKGFESGPEEDYLSLGAEACNFLQSQRLKPKIPPPVAPKPVINPNSPPWSAQIEAANQGMPQCAENSLSTPAAAPTTEMVPASELEPTPAPATEPPTLPNPEETTADPPTAEQHSWTLPESESQQQPPQVTPQEAHGQVISAQHSETSQMTSWGSAQAETHQQLSACSWQSAQVQPQNPNPSHSVPQPPWVTRQVQPPTTVNDWRPHLQQTSLNVPMSTVNTQPSPKPWHPSQNQTPPPRRMFSYTVGQKAASPVNPLATVLNPKLSQGSAFEMPVIRGKGADMFAKRQSRMEKFVVDSETVEANKASRSTSPAVSLPNEWKYTPNVRAPPPKAYNPIQSPFYPPAATKQPPASSPSIKAKKKDQDKPMPTPKPLNVIDVMKHQPYKLDSALFIFGPGVEAAKPPTPKPTSPLNSLPDSQTIGRYPQISPAQQFGPFSAPYAQQDYGIPTQPVVHDPHCQHAQTNVYPYQPPPGGLYQQEYNQQYQQPVPPPYQFQAPQPLNLPYQQAAYQPASSPPYLAAPSVSYKAQPTSSYNVPSFPLAARSESINGGSTGAAPKPKFTANKSSAQVWKPTSVEKE